MVCAFSCSCCLDLLSHCCTKVQSADCNEATVPHALGSCVVGLQALKQNLDKHCEKAAEAIAKGTFR